MINVLRLGWLELLPKPLFSFVKSCHIRFSAPAVLNRRWTGCGFRSKSRFGNHNWTEILTPCLPGIQAVCLAILCVRPFPQSAPFA